MPKFRSYFKGRYKSAPFTKKGRQMEKSIMNLYRKVNQIKSNLNVEYKVHNVQMTAANATNAGSIVPLCHIDQGDDEGSRDGAQIKITSIYATFFAVPNTSEVIRIMLVQDKQVNGAAFTLGDLLHDPTATDNIVSPLQLVNKFRFKILYNQVLAIDTDTSKMYRKYYKRFSKGIKIRYNGTGGGTADITSNGLYLVFLSDVGVNYPTLTYNVRIRFVDN